MRRLPAWRRSRPRAVCGAAGRRSGDLDLLVTGPDPTPALERFVQFARVHEVLGRGENKASANVGLEGIQVDVRALPAESFGAAMQYFTGSKDHNVALRQRALQHGADAERIRAVHARYE